MYMLSSQKEQSSAGSFLLQMGVTGLEAAITTHHLATLVICTSVNPIHSHMIFILHVNGAVFFDKEEGGNL
jgi:hypothetical protein